MTLSIDALPRATFVLGKGGVGRSTVAAALGLELARRGRRACVFGWTVEDPIGPWFGAPPAGLTPAEVAPGLSVANYRLEDTLELYFVGHLRLPRFHRHVIRSRHVRELIDAAPGLAEVFFVGHVWWLTTLAEKEAGLRFDHVIVDAPATGHGVSLLDLPAVLASLRASGLVAVETERITAMMSDPASTGTVIVTLAEELAEEETAELVPRVTQRMGRPPLGILVNRSAAHLAGALHRRDWLDELFVRLSAEARDGLETITSELSARIAREAAMRASLSPLARHGVLGIRDALSLGDHPTPRDVVDHVRRELVGGGKGTP